MNNPNQTLTKTVGMRRSLLATAFLLTAWFISGCTSDVQSQRIAESDTFVLDTRPSLATTIGIAKEKLADESVVAIEGWVDLKFFEGQDNEAKVLVREILDDTEHGGEGHDPSSCPFCKRRMDAAPKAVVVFTDKNNKILPYSVEELFPLKHGDKVVVKGTGILDEGLDLFNVRATGIYVSN